MKAEEMYLTSKRKEMSKEAWIKNVLRIFPNRTREETEDLWYKLSELERNSQPPKDHTER